MLKIRLLGFLIAAMMLAMLVPASHAFAATRQNLRPNDDASYFILNNTLNPSNASGTGIADGASIQLDPSVVEGSVTDTFQHTLFAVDSSGNITVYSAGNSPVAAQVSQNGDGSEYIEYNESSNTVTASFTGTMANGQMTATYQQQALGGNVVGGQEYIGGTDITESFTTTVNEVTADQIPASPSNGQYQLSSDGGVLLSWAPATSDNVSGYDVYRQILGTDSLPQLQTMTTDTSYTDESPEAIQNAQTATGILYTIYAVGPTGIENPQDVEIYAESISV